MQKANICSAAQHSQARFLPEEQARACVYMAKALKYHLQWGQEHI